MKKKLKKFWECVVKLFSNLLKHQSDVYYCGEEFCDDMVDVESDLFKYSLLRTLWYAVAIITAIINLYVSLFMVIVMAVFSTAKYIKKKLTKK